MDLKILFTYKKELNISCNHINIFSVFVYVVIFILKFLYTCNWLFCYLYNEIITKVMIHVLFLVSKHNYCKKRVPKLRETDNITINNERLWMVSKIKRKFNRNLLSVLTPRIRFIDTLVTRVKLITYAQV